MTARSGEDGLAAPAVVVLAGLVLVAATLCGVLGRLLVEHRHAGAAADLAALAGAVALQHGRPGCPAAERVAAANGARLESCRVVADRIRVAASRTAPLPGGREATVSATAHAGPVAAGPVSPGAVGPGAVGPGPVTPGP
jgi:secretion/DNA translocation related TadE-like protein